MNECWSNIPLAKFVPECFFCFLTSLSLLCVDQHFYTHKPYMYFVLCTFRYELKKNKEKERKKENNNSLQQSAGEMRHSLTQSAAQSDAV